MPDREPPAYVGEGACRARYNARRGLKLYVQGGEFMRPGRGENLRLPDKGTTKREILYICNVITSSEMALFYPKRVRALFFARKYPPFSEGDEFNCKVRELIH